MAVQGDNFTLVNTGNAFEQVNPTVQKGRIRYLTETILFDEAVLADQIIPVFAQGIKANSEIVTVISLSDTLVASTGKLVTTDRDLNVLTEVLVLTGLNGATEIFYPIFDVNYKVLLGEGRHWGISLDTGEAGGAKVFQIVIWYVEN